MTESYRILVLGDFGAREHRGLAGAGMLATPSRRPRRVDRDDLDAAIAAIAPELHLAIEPGTPPVVVPIRALDDFHPDHLLTNVTELRQLRAMRADAAKTPASKSASSPPPSSSPSSAASAAAAMSGGSVLDMILDADGGAGGTTATRPPHDELSAFVSQSVQKYAVPQPSVDQQTLIQKIDDVTVATLRVLLHHPQFQAAEALWRGAAFLARHLDTDESLQIWVCDISKSELIAAVSSPADPSGRALRSMLRGENRQGPWSLVVGGYSCTPDEMDVVAGLAAVARDTGVPWLVAANSRFAGASSFAESADPDDWDATPIPAWDAFRRTADAQWIGLVLPRILMRVPYGSRSDECDSIRFEETNDGQLPHDHYLWGNAAFVCATLLGEAAGSGESLPTQGVVDGMPLYIGKVDGLPETVPCAEAVLTHRAVAQLLDRGLTAVASERDGDSVRVPRVQSSAMPPAPLAQSRSSDIQ